MTRQEIGEVEQDDGYDRAWEDDNFLALKLLVHETNEKSWLGLCEP
jgi:hypothetical protein